MEDEEDSIKGKRVNFQPPMKAPAPSPSCCLQIRQIAPASEGRQGRGGGLKEPWPGGSGAGGQSGDQRSGGVQPWDGLGLLEETMFKLNL